MNQLNQPLVSICTTTYNREKYIGEAIESCMMQKTNFPFEMVISDNCSTDKTVEIIESYIQKFPGKIRLLKSDKNYGLMLNYIKSIEAGTGKYIADCDGDDYWTDENKLQMQVDFLEANPDFVMCFTNNTLLNSETGETEKGVLKTWDVGDTSLLLSYNTLNKEINLNGFHCPAHVSTIVFRNNVIKFPDWFKDLYINDEPLFFMLSKFGKAKFIDQEMSVYRMTPVGYSTQEFTYMRDWTGRIDFYKKIDAYFDGKHHKQISDIIKAYNRKIFKYYFDKKEYLKATQYLLKMYV